jgi:hypothetical protein
VECPVFARSNGVRVAFTRLLMIRSDMQEFVTFDSIAVMISLSSGGAIGAGVPAWPPKNHSLSTIQIRLAGEKDNVQRACVQAMV